MFKLIVSQNDCKSVYLLDSGIPSFKGCNIFFYPLRGAIDYDNPFRIFTAFLFFVLSI